MSLKQRLVLIILLFQTPLIVWADVPTHEVWNTLLHAHVSPMNHGKATVVDYQGMKENQKQLEAYLKQLADITPQTFDAWPPHDQMAFLINAYNAATVQLILTVWPNLQSIKDLGNLFRSPWSKEFITLLGKTRSLDNIEHNLLRDSERYRDPRIHFAVNCASIGCPALRPEAYTGARLDAQLNEQTHLFLSDRSRNRVENNVLELSSIFKWYREDFEKGWQGYNRLEDFLVAKAHALDLKPTLITQLTAGEAKISFLNYDWRLNQAQNN